MTASRSPNIPRCPRRDEIEAAARVVLVRGAGGKADVFGMSVDGTRVLVKDFKGRAPWARLVGRLQTGREAAAYAWLAGVPGVPAFVGRIDPWALAIEWIDGERLAFASLLPGQATALVARLRGVVDAIHARGVVHNDLRGRENVLLRAGGDLAVVDFAAALRMRPGGLMHRLFFRTLATTDEAAFLKWKGMIAPGSLTAEDEAFLKRFARWRALWPFNPKRRKRARAA